MMIFLGTFFDDKGSVSIAFSRSGALSTGSVSTAFCGQTC